jgi:CBS domain-containing protein
MKTVSDILVHKAISVRPDTPILEAANLLLKHGFSGLPVVDTLGRVVGIVTEYDFILKKNSLHLLTLVRVFNDLDVFKKDSGPVKEDLKKLLDMKVEDIMNADPLMIPSTSTIEEAVKVFEEHHRVNPIIVVGADNALIGVVSRHDVLKFLGDGGDVDALYPRPGQNIDDQANQFIKNLEKQFLLVSKSRTRWWAVASITFAIVGFAVAWLLILRVNF